MSNQERYFQPTHLNKESFLSVWWMENPKDTVCFIQVSEDKENPIWMKLSDVLEMLVRHIPNWENTLLTDVLTALKSHECISTDFIKKNIIR